MNISNQGVYDYTRKAMSIYAKDQNTNSAMPNVLDGLKVVYKRSIVTLLEKPDKMMKTALVAADALKLHPHGQTSVEEVMDELVQSGICDGQGNHGLTTMLGDDIDASASRYTEMKLNAKYRKIFGDMIQYVPKVEAEIEGYEPAYIPTPIPLIFGLTSQFGLGIGANCQFCSLDPKSLLNAYLNNDHNLLRSPHPDVEIDYENSDLESIWNTGLGKITYKAKVFSEDFNGEHTWVVRGCPDIFKPKFNDIITDALNAGDRIWCQDESGEYDGRYVSQIRIGRITSQRKFSDRDLDQMVLEWGKEMWTSSIYVRLTVTDTESAFLIPLREWIKRCYENYLGLVNIYKNSNIDKIQYEIAVQLAIPVIGAIITNNPKVTEEEIKAQTNLPEDVIKSVLAKPIKSLMRNDSEAKIAALNAKLEEFRSLDPAQYTQDIVNQI